MLRERVLGNLADYAVGTRALERVAVDSDDCAKRVLRIATSAGDIGLRFDDASRVRDGDVIYADESVVIAIAVGADDVLVGRPTSVASALAVAHALGNRHLPMQVDGDTLVVRYEPLLPALFAEHGVIATRETRVVAAPFRHAHAPHGHDDDGPT